MIRIRYPDGAERPNIKMTTAEFTVVDLSEGGMKFACRNPEIFPLGHIVAATLSFSTGRSFPLEGAIYRRDRDGIAIRFTKPISKEALRYIGRDQRAYFRLRYPNNERPHLRATGGSTEATEISERGIRMVVSGIPVTALVLGATIKATITFADHETTEIEGIVYRFDKHEVILTLTKPLSMSRIMKEQRYLVQKYYHKT
ncbi:MAG: PilZ domain-containing protein [bacterium]